MKILVLGSSGMAGNVVTQTMIEAGFDVDNISGSKPFNENTILLDLTDKNNFEQFLDNHNYDVIINCVGVLVEASEKRKDLSTYLNCFLPHFLEHKYENSKTKVIHLSTDCVFSGKNGPYKEDSFQDGELYYDRTKALGEINNKKDLTFRMSIIGPDMQENGVGLFNWFFKQTGKISGYKETIWSGITTIELAKGIKEAITQDLTGIYHLVPKEGISKYELLKLFKKEFKRDDIEIEGVSGPAMNKTLINTRKDFNYQVPDYPQMVKEMRQWAENHQDLYPHYKKEVKN
jgi:dTDP-4-dehydrorhamnose reductase